MTKTEDFMEQGGTFDDAETPDVYTETVGKSHITAEAAAELSAALEKIRNQDPVQSELQNEPPNWELSDATKEIGRRGLADARKALEATESPTEKLMLENQARKAAELTPPANEIDPAA